MKSTLILASTCVSVLTAACSHSVRHVAPLPTLHSDDEVSATVRTPDGDLREQAVQPTGAGSTAFKTAGGVAIDDDSVVDVTVTTRDRGRGALEGGLIGLGVGAVVGNVLWYASFRSATDCVDDASCEGHDVLNGTFGGLAGAIGVSLIGTVTGVVLGAAYGHTRHDVYEVSAVPQVGVAPTVGGAQASAAWRF